MKIKAIKIVENKSDQKTEKDIRLVSVKCGMALKDHNKRLKPTTNK